jgi:hypothetical protein
MFNSSESVAGNILLLRSSTLKYRRTYKHFAPTERSHMVDKCVGA